ncbi:hypothetical protein [Pantoea cypripedii]|uniref:Nucleoside phosphorylase domain-containing protein n=1 Tax=Pantoea cypripedii TaxID=55209 RepID=A0A6B9GGS0_PANCY|nr:hypothetical protein [Pantoea cypripedii]QGY32506.1 hypothetical protein CUN67_26450 [Pantoea cypripedii]
MRLSDYKKVLEGNFILLLTSNSKEKSAINAIINNIYKVTIDEDNRGAYFGMIGNAFVLHLSGESGTINNFSIINVCKAFISNAINPNPALIILSGICWGDPNNTKLGMTIVSDELITANQQTITNAGSIPKTRTFKSLFSIDDDCFSDNDNVIVGKTCSAELLIKDADFRAKLLALIPDCLGGEMEGFALIPALRDCNWLMVKTISDFADDDTYSRDEQLKFCERLASDIEYIIPRLITSLELPFNIESDEAVLIQDIISGPSIEFNINNFDYREMNTVLNDSYGKVILRKLSNYIDGEVFKDEFMYDMADLILELVQNEFRHNNAVKIIVKFDTKSISFDSGTDFYDISSIEGYNGGAIAWRNVLDKFITSGDIEYLYKSDRLEFKLKSFVDKINVIKSRCKVTLDPSKSGYSRFRPALDFDKTCTSVYYDMRGEIMSSRAIGIFEQIEKIVKNDIMVYLSVRDQNQKEKYMKLLSEYEGMIKFIN